MTRLWFSMALVVALPVMLAPQTSRPDGTRRNPPAEALSHDSSSLKTASVLLEIAEQDAYRMEGPMRAWGLWQVARAYQATNQKKALRLLDAALAEAAVMKDVPPPKMQEEMMRAMNGTQAKPTRTWLQEQIARTIIMIDPSRADELLQTLDAASRGPVLQALMSYYENHKLTDRAVEQFYRIAAQDEAPYTVAIRIIAILKPDQSSELAGILGACLASYRAHAPHDFPMNDQFPQLVMTYWQRAPQQLVRDAIDEILKQAQDSKENTTFSMSFDKGNRAAGSMLEYRLAQLMPAMRELETAKTREYLEKFPSVGELAESYATSTSGSTAANGGANPTPGFRVNGDSGNLFMNMTEWPLAERVAAKADAGHADEAIAEAATVSNPDLKVQALEHIARAMARKDPIIATSALGKMLAAVGKVKLDRQPGYYASASGIFLTLGDTESAKDAIEKGLGAAVQLYKQDTDSDDPNTALEAFWPSTNAYCMLLRQARQISELWTFKLLKEIDNPQLRFAAETAVASSALNVPESRTTIITSKRKSFSMSLGADLPEGSKN